VSLSSFTNLAARLATADADVKIATEAALVRNRLKSSVLHWGSLLMILCLELALCGIQSDMWSRVMSVTSARMTRLRHSKSSEHRKTRHGHF
jgi:hypothetical protein